MPLQRYCCIDRFLAETIPGERHARAVRAQIQELYRGGGGWRAGQTGGGRGGHGQRETVAAVRGDQITIAEVDDPRLPALGEMRPLESPAHPKPCAANDRVGVGGTWKV